MSDFADFEWDLEYEAKLRACGIEPWRPKPKRPRGRLRSVSVEVVDLIKEHFPELPTRQEVLCKCYVLLAQTALRDKPGNGVVAGVAAIFDPDNGVAAVGVLQHLGRTMIACELSNAETQAAARWIAANRAANPRFNTLVVATFMRELRKLISTRQQLGLTTHPIGQLLDMLYGGRA